MRIKKYAFAGIFVLAGLMLGMSTASALNRISDIRNTKHNFSATVLPQSGTDGASRTVKASSEAEICVFCHTPHGANTASGGPLWNRSLPSGTPYTMYSSSSIDSTIESQPNGVSKLCLSCHDGSIAIGSVLNVRTQKTTISMTGTGSGGTMPAGAGQNTGFTRKLGQDLTNDHPISLTYNTGFVNADTEMRSPGTDPIHVRGMTPRPAKTDIQLQPTDIKSPSNQNGQVQCISCHDPHIRDTTDTNIKFLRLNRLQKAAPTGTAANNYAFSKQNDIICLACHTKKGWSGSAHAQPNVANETYTNAAADAREFPRGTQVWESACLACHDTHTVSGSRRLLREGVDGSTTTLSGYTIKAGNGQAAIEETCYACHGPSRGTLQGQGGGTFEVPDTQSDFGLATHMPITNSEQAAGHEVHDIGTAGGDGGGADMIESQTLLDGSGHINRHAECTDCHNPHRVTKRSLFYQDDSGGNMDSQGTHNHAGGHTNLASGVLRGAWGVEPQYSSNNFHNDPSGFTVKRGLPGNTSTAVTNSWVTREYQVCLKCHSSYAFGNGYNAPPPLGVSTSSGTNGMSRYTNVAREYNSPSTHAGEPRNVGQDGGADNAPACCDWNNNNHRAWHPVRAATGRTYASRLITTGPNNWLSPFNATADVGSQTMYCTDCHGTDTAQDTAVPGGSQPNGKPWGPHGSMNDFILKGTWSGDAATGTGTGTHATGLCFKCHRYDDYANPNNTAPDDSGYQLDGGNGGGGMGGMAGGNCMGGGGMCGGMGGAGGGGGVMNNLHIFHANQVTNFRCNLCHVAVPHGWKNKNFLVNLNDVSREYSQPSPDTFGNNPPIITSGYREMRGCGGGGDGKCGRRVTYPPYYNKAALKIRTFAASGHWVPADCGSSGQNGGNGQSGVQWMAGGNEACANIQ
jgi:cytochrome c553